MTSPKRGVDQGTRFEGASLRRSVSDFVHAAFDSQCMSAERVQEISYRRNLLDTEAEHVETCERCQAVLAVARATMSHPAPAKLAMAAIGVIEPEVRQHLSAQHCVVCLRDVEILKRRVRSSLDDPSAIRSPTRKERIVQKLLGVSSDASGFLQKRGVRAYPLVFGAFGGTVLAAVLHVVGQDFAAAALLACALAIEAVDGDLAKRWGDSRRAVLVDYILDRVAEGALYLALATRAWSEHAVAGLAISALCLSLLGSYIRAEAAALQFIRVRVQFSRFGRLALVGTGLAIGGTMVWMLIAVNIIGFVTIVRRFTAAWKEGAWSDVEAVLRPPSWDNSHLPRLVPLNGLEHAPNSREWTNPHE